MTKEELEKEAEEIVNKSLCSKMMCYGHCSFSSPKHHRCGDWHRCYEIAKKGAEFGYNKANEWHYVKDGDLPKESCIVYYKDSFGVPSWSVVHPTWYIADVEAFFKNNPQIIAWKEIVLPELKESE